ncbi:TonB-dependent receptor [Lutibacter sp. A80]|uniref:SusC/RagA family TonB-linked outer membrane protein n=1 Tax=Lutibacter sp. A80 TaxID=2918453 RepID=UPI001F061068|nr:TonB-dependent receptor [Lutibacter sp. A80]UMB59218.1 TonB-dependent receptor [Lutibacter sp. A80]
MKNFINLKRLYFYDLEFDFKTKFISLFLLIFLFQIQANASDISDIPQQEKIISGIVTDDQGAPLPGASIIVKGTSNGVTTDFDGKFSINIDANSTTLVVSYIGFQTVEVAIGDTTDFVINLKSSAESLSEVVVVGYGTQKKVNLTGSVGTVESETFESRPVQSATQMLQGAVGGLNISSTGGSLEDESTINIRGVATIGDGSTGAPLVLIDGMEGDINSINPQDIENVSVLKDAAASSIYGSRAPFGVILITTKKGRKGLVSVNYNNSFRVSSPINMPDMMDSYTFATYFNDANINGGKSPMFGEERMERILAYQQGTLTASIIPNPNNPERWADGYAEGNANVDWYDALYRDSSFSQEHNLSLRGGGDAITYYLSANFLDQDGLMEFNRDKFNRYTTTAKINAKITDWATVNLSNRFIREDYGRPSKLNNSLFQNLARQGWPVLPLYDPNGYLYSSPSPALGLSEGGRDESQKDWVYQQAQLILKPLEGWEIFGEFNFRSLNNFRHWDVLQTFNHDVSGSPYLKDSASSVYEEASRENYYNTNIYTNYSKTLNEKHNFKVLLGFQSELNKFRELSAERDGVIIPSSPVLDLTSGTDSNGNTVAPSVSGEYQSWATEGFFGRLNYDYDGKYLFEANIRRDGTSRYRDDKRWKTFPSFSAGWNIAKETFWESISADITTFKLRGSWGELGNQNTTNWYPTYVTMPVNTASGDWLVNGSRPNTSSAPGLVSQSLTWERVQSWNVGLDISAFNSRLTSSIDYFTRNTLDMVGPAPELPVALGTSVPKTNNTDLKTYGFELNVAWRDYLDNGLNYQIQLLLSDSQTKITKYPNATNSFDLYREGQLTGEIWGYETIGIAKTDAEMAAHLASLPEGGQNAIGSQWTAGDIMYKDLNNDGKIDSGSWTEDDPGDRKIIGNNTARFPFSINLSADYKGFDARVFFQGIMKRDYFSSSPYFWGASGSGIWWSTGLAEHADYFRADENHYLGQNLDSYYPRPLFNDKNKQSQTRYLQDASYIRMKNIQLGYTLPTEVVEKVGMQKLRIFISGENLWTITNLTSVFDPETIQYGSNGNGNAYPLSKTISAGLTLNF